MAPEVTPPRVIFSSWLTMFQHSVSSGWKEGELVLLSWAILAETIKEKVQAKPFNVACAEALPPQCSKPLALPHPSGPLHQRRPHCLAQQGIDDGRILRWWHCCHCWDCRAVRAQRKHRRALGPQHYTKWQTRLPTFNIQLITIRTKAYFRCLICT